MSILVPPCNISQKFIIEGKKDMKPFPRTVQIFLIVCIDGGIIIEPSSSK